MNEDNFNIISRDICCRSEITAISLNYLFMCHVAAWSADNGGKRCWNYMWIKTNKFFRLMLSDLIETWGGLFLPRLGLRRSCTPACSAAALGESGRWLCTSRWWCQTLPGDAPTSLRRWCRSGCQPEHSAALKRKLQTVENEDTVGWDKKNVWQVREEKRPKKKKKNQLQVNIFHENRWSEATLHFRFKVFERNLMLIDLTGSKRLNSFKKKPSSGVRGWCLCARVHAKKRCLFWISDYR